VDAAGWLAPSEDLVLDNVFMGEFQNEGPGSRASERVNWSTQISKNQTTSFNVKNFISGSKWLPLTHITFEELT